MTACYLFPYCASPATQVRWSRTVHGEQVHVCDYHAEVSDCVGKNLIPRRRKKAYRLWLSPWSSTARSVLGDEQSSWQELAFKRMEDGPTE